MFPGHFVGALRLRATATVMSYEIGLSLSPIEATLGSGEHGTEICGSRELYPLVRILRQRLETSAVQETGASLGSSWMRPVQQ